MHCHFNYKLPTRRVLTLVELVIVISIIMILSGIVLANVKLPVFASLDNTTRGVRKIFGDAQRQTALQGKEIQVLYNPESKEFKLMPAAALAEEESSSFSIEGDYDIEKVNSQWTFEVPEKIEVEFPEYEEDTILYRFFPDGAATGPEMALTLEGRTILVGVSRLTGIAYSREKKEL